MPHRPRALTDVMRVLPVRTPTLPPATHTNSYLVGTGQRVLVEPASPYLEENQRTIAWLEEELGATGTLQALVLTHHHPDHVGGANTLAQHFDVPIWAHAATRQRLEGHVRIDRDLEDGDWIVLDGPTRVELEVMHTPGHAPGHLCFTERRSGQMIAGDMVAEVGTILVEPTDGDMELYLESLLRMGERKPSALLPAHGRPLENPQEVLAFYRRHRLEREAKVLAALQKRGRGTARELLDDAYADAPRAAWPLAERSTEAHLIKLERDGRVSRDGAGWSA